MTTEEKLDWIKRGIMATVADANLFILRRGLTAQELEEWGIETIEHLISLINKE